MTRRKTQGYQLINEASDRQLYLECKLTGNLGFHMLDKNA